MTKNEVIEKLKLFPEWNRCDLWLSDDDMEDLVNSCVKALGEIQQYRAIGTVEECREAIEKQNAKEPVEYEDKYYACPNCDNILMHKWERYPFQMKDKKNGLPYCLSCGQAILWELQPDSP